MAQGALRLAVGARARNINGNSRVGMVYTYTVSGDVITHYEEVENPLAYEINYNGESLFGSSVTVYGPDGMMAVSSIRNEEVLILRPSHPAPPLPPSPPPSPPPRSPPPSPPPPRWVHVIFKISSPCHNCGVLWGADIHSKLSPDVLCMCC